MPREADPNKRYPSLAIPTQIRLPVLVESLMENRIQSFSRDKDVYNSLLFLRYCSLVIPVDNRIVEFYLYFKKIFIFRFCQSSLPTGNVCIFFLFLCYPPIGRIVVRDTQSERKLIYRRQFRQWVVHFEPRIFMTCRSVRD